MLRRMRVRYRLVLLALPLLLPSCGSGTTEPSDSSALSSQYSSSFSLVNDTITLSPAAQAQAVSVAQ